MALEKSLGLISPPILALPERISLGLISPPILALPERISPAYSQSHTPGGTPGMYVQGLVFWV